MAGGRGQKKRGSSDQNNSNGKQKKKANRPKEYRKFDEITQTIRGGIIKSCADAYLKNVAENGGKSCRRGFVKELLEETNKKIVGFKVSRDDLKNAVRDRRKEMSARTKEVSPVPSDSSSRNSSSGASSSTSTGAASTGGEPSSEGTSPDSDPGSEGGRASTSEASLQRLSILAEILEQEEAAEQQQFELDEQEPQQQAEQQASQQAEQEAQQYPQLPNRCSYAGCGVPPFIRPEPCSTSNCPGTVHPFCQAYASGKR